jgi:hypothetical protein
MQETPLSTIQTLLSDGYLLTLSNPLYATTLVVITALLVAILYGIRIGALKKKIATVEQACHAVQSTLDNAQQRILSLQEEVQQTQDALQKSQEQHQAIQVDLQKTQAERQKIQDVLAVTQGEVEKNLREVEQEVQRSNALEQHIYQRNKQIYGMIQALATHFYFSESPVCLTDDFKAEALWQQYDNIIGQLAWRLRSGLHTQLELRQAYQAETAKQHAQEAQIALLKTTLVTQACQLTQHEQALNEQKSILQQQRNETQNALADALEKQQADLADSAELNDVKQQLRQLTEQLAAKDTLIVQLENAKPAVIMAVELPASMPVMQAEQQVEVIQSIVAPVLPEQQEAPAMLAVAQEDAKTENVANQENITIVAAIPEELNVQPEPVVDVQPEPVATPEKPQEEQAANPVFGKIKQLFGRQKQEPEAAMPEAVAEVQPEPVVEELEKTEAVASQLKGLYRKLTTKADS